MSQNEELAAPAEVVYRVHLRAEVAAGLRAFAAREGASPEALAALWLEEKWAEAQRLLPGPATPPLPPDTDELARGMEED